MFDVEIELPAIVNKEIRDVENIKTVGGHLGRALGNEIEHLVWGLKQCKPARGVQGHASPKNFET